MYSCKGEAMNFLNVFFITSLIAGFVNIMNTINQGFESCYFPIESSGLVVITFKFLGPTDQDSQHFPYRKCI